MPSTEAYSIFSANAYETPWNSKPERTIPDSWKRLPINPLFLDDPVTGLRAHVYHNNDLKEVVIAYAGTHRGDKGDLEAIGEIIRGRLPKQFLSARNVYRRVLEYLDHGRIRALISFTGHSLGGAMAQYMAIAAKGTPAETFGAPGILQAQGELEGEYDPGFSYPVVNHIAWDDSVGHYGWHLGRITRYAFGSTNLAALMIPFGRQYQGHQIERYLGEFRRGAASIKYTGKCTYENGKKYEMIKRFNWSGQAITDYILSR